MHSALQCVTIALSTTEDKVHVVETVKNFNYAFLAYGGHGNRNRNLMISKALLKS